MVQTFFVCLALSRQLCSEGNTFTHFISCVETSNSACCLNHGFTSVFPPPSMCQAGEMCVLLCDFGRSCTCERPLRIMRYISLPLNQQNLSLTGLVVIIIITEAIISSQSLQDIYKAIWFVHLLIRLYQHHLILQYRERICYVIKRFNWTFYIQYIMYAV